MRPEITVLSILWKGLARATQDTIDLLLAALTGRLRHADYVSRLSAITDRLRALEAETRSAANLEPPK